MAKKKTTRRKAAKDPKKLRILSIDGGGIRGILPGQILVKLEAILQKQSNDPDARIADYFDLVAGTSTGGILACALLCPEDPSNAASRPKYTAQDAVDIYLERGDDIFDVSLWESVWSGGGVLDEKHDAAELEEALQDFMGDTKLSQLLKPCLVTAYDIKRRCPFFFRQHRAAERNSYDFLVRDVCRSTSAAPTFFEAARVKSMTSITYPLIDGGVFANNPAMCAFTDARSEQVFGKRVAKDMIMLSIGTGGVKKGYPYRKAKDWGKAEWIVPMIDILMTGNSDTVRFQLQHIFEAERVENQYLRIDPDLRDASPEMDNASQENLLALKEAGTEAAQDHEEELETFAKLLLAP